MKLNTDGSVEGTPTECSEYQDIQAAKEKRQHFKSVTPTFLEQHENVVRYNMIMDHWKLVRSNPYWTK